MYSLRAERTTIMNELQEEMGSVKGGREVGAERSEPSQGSETAWASETTYRASCQTHSAVAAAPPPCAPQLLPLSPLLLPLSPLLLLPPLPLLPLSPLLLLPPLPLLPLSPLLLLPPAAAVAARLNRCCSL